jgi:hypothetical protein
MFGVIDLIVVLHAIMSSEDLLRASDTQILINQIHVIQLDFK